MGVTSDRIIKLGLIDQIIDEPLGGAHRDVDETAKRLKASLKEHLHKLQAQSIDKIVEARYEKLMSFGLKK